MDELYSNIKEAVAPHFEDDARSTDIDIPIVSKLKLSHTPAATD